MEAMLALLGLDQPYTATRVGQTVVGLCAVLLGYALLVSTWAEGDPRRSGGARTVYVLCALAIVALIVEWCQFRGWL